MNITRRIHLNPQSKGNLGKSFEAEFRVAWLDMHGLAWNGSDLDDRHHTFASRHPESVRSYQLGNEHESKTALLSLFRRVLKDIAPVHVIDTRAQADALILGALEELQVLEVCADEGLRLTFFLFPTDDTESMNNVGRLFLYAGDRVDYVIVHNPVKARGDLFKGSALEKQLLAYGARAITLPAITPTTLLAMEKAEAAAKRGLSFAELSHVEPRYLERLLAGEIQWTMQKMFRQYDALADLLLPTELVPEKPAATPPASFAAVSEPELNFEE
jgi:hypothetical protein